MSSGSYGDGLAGMEAANRRVVVDVEIRGVHAALLDPALELLELRAVRCRHDRCQTNDDDEDRRLVSSEPSLNEKKAAAAAVARSQQRGGQQRTQDAGQGEDHNKACHWGRRERESEHETTRADTSSERPMTRRKREREERRGATTSSETSDTENTKIGINAGAPWRSLITTEHSRANSIARSEARERPKSARGFLISFARASSASASSLSSLLSRCCCFCLRALSLSIDPPLLVVVVVQAA